MILTILLVSIGLARALQSFPLPNIKPFNCQSCLSFWLSLVALGVYDWKWMHVAFITYLLSDLILIYENK